MSLFCLLQINIIILCKVMKEINSLRTSDRRDSHVRSVRYIYFIYTVYTANSKKVVALQTLQDVFALLVPGLLTTCYKVVELNRLVTSCYRPAIQQFVNKL